VLGAIEAAERRVVDIHWHQPPQRTCKGANKTSPLSPPEVPVLPPREIIERAAQVKACQIVIYLTTPRLALRSGWPVAARDTTKQSSVLRSGGWSVPCLRMAY